MRRVLLAALLCGGLGWSGAAHAQVKVSVFDVEAGGGAQPVAAAITATLRRVISNQSSLAILPGKSLAEIKLVFGCAEHPVAAFHQCLAKVGTSLKANRIVIGKVRKRGSGYHVVLTLIDVAYPLRPRSVSEHLDASKASGGALDRKVVAWFNALFHIVTTGTVEVRCSVSGATLQVDGRDAGLCRGGVTRLTLSQGAHTIMASKEGFLSASRAVTVRVGASVSVQLTLERSAVAPPPGEGRQPPPDERTPPGNEGVTPPVTPPKKRDKTLVWKVVFYSTLSAGAALLIGSIFTGMKVKSLEQDKEDIIRRSWENQDTNLWITDTQNACKHNKGNTQLVKVCNDGTNMATVTNVLIGLGAALVAGSGYFLYRAYFAKDRKEHVDVEPPVAPTRPAFTLTPELWERGGGVRATLRF